MWSQPVWLQSLGSRECCWGRPSTRLREWLRPSSSSLGKKLEQSLVPGCLCSWASPCWVDSPLREASKVQLQWCCLSEAPEHRPSGSAAPWLLHQGWAHPSIRVSTSCNWLPCSVYPQLWALLRQRLGLVELSVPKAQSEACSQEGTKGAADEW